MQYKTDITLLITIICSLLLSCDRRKGGDDDRVLDLASDKLFMLKDLKVSRGENLNKVVLLKNSSKNSLKVQVANFSCDCLDAPVKTFEMLPMSHYYYTISINMKHNPDFVGGLVLSCEFQIESDGGLKNVLMSLLARVE